MPTKPTSLPLICQHKSLQVYKKDLSKKWLKLYWPQLLFSLYVYISARKQAINQHQPAASATVSNGTVTTMTPKHLILLIHYESAESFACTFIELIELHALWVIVQMLRCWRHHYFFNDYCWIEDHELRPSTLDVSSIYYKQSIEDQSTGNAIQADIISTWSLEWLSSKESKEIVLMPECFINNSFINKTSPFRANRPILKSSSCLKEKYHCFTSVSTWSETSTN